MGLVRRDSRQLGARRLVQAQALEHWQKRFVVMGHEVGRHWWQEAELEGLQDLVRLNWRRWQEGRLDGRDQVALLD